jgi:hypothetical protein
MNKKIDLELEELAKEMAYEIIDDKTEIAFLEGESSGFDKAVSNLKKALKILEKNKHKVLA